MDNLHLFLEIVPALLIVLIASRCVGRLVTYVGQPRVVGEMIAGVLLGPTLLGQISPAFMNNIFTDDVKGVLFILCNIGLSFYMFLIGAELDLNHFNKSSLKKAGLVATSGIIPPFLFGIGIAYLLYESMSLSHVSQVNFAIYMGVALSITAFPMLARILQDENLIRTNLGSMSLIAASIDDAAAWCFLAVVTAMAQAESMMSGLFTALWGALFAIVVIKVVKPMMKKWGDNIQERGSLSQGEFGVIVILLLAAAWFTDFIGIYSVFGGFILGLAVPRTPVFQRELHGKLTDIVVVFLLPIFFTYSGLNADLSGIFQMHLLWPSLIILVGAIAGKYFGCAFAMRRMGFSWGESSAIGGLMNARGLMELIVVNIGLTYGIISQDLYSALILMAVITTALSMPIYNLSMGKKFGKGIGVYAMLKPNHLKKVENTVEIPSSRGNSNQSMNVEDKSKASS